MKNYSIPAILASGLAALAIGLATPAVAAPSGPNDDNNGGTSQHDIPSANDWANNAGMTPYGTYQNLNPRHAGSRR